jgi:hypothetical protein
MNAAKRAVAAERMAAANAAANADVPPDAQAPPVVPPVVPAAALPPAAQVVIGASALAQLLAACQAQPHVAGAILPKQAGSTRLKAFSSTDSVVRSVSLPQSQCTGGCQQAGN